MQSILTTRPGRDEETRHVRLPAPLGERLTLLDEPNERVKLYLATPSMFTSEVGEEFLDSFSDTDAYTKLTVYAGEGDKEDWEKLGFVHEGTIANYFFDGRDAHIWSHYGGSDRAENPNAEEHENVLESANAQDPLADIPELPEHLSLSRGSIENAPAISELLTSVHPDYPEDISPKRIKQLAGRGSTAFRLIRSADDVPVAVAGVRLDMGNRSGQISFFATHEDYEDRGLAEILIHGLEQDARTRFGVTDLYALPPADDVEFNTALRKLQYTFTGRLVNSDRMPDGWASTNIWCKNTG